MAACGGSSGTADRGEEQADALFAKELPAVGGFTITSPNFADGAALPIRFTCDSTNISPALRVEGAPADAVELAIVMDDPGADNGTFVHWIVGALQPAGASLAEDLVPDGASQARNSDGRSAYKGPCPPKDEPAHTYRITVYALNKTTGTTLKNEPAGKALDAIAERATAKATMSATYQRKA